MKKEELEEKGVVGALFRRARQYQLVDDMELDVKPGPFPDCYVKDAKKDLEEELRILGVNMEITEEHTKRVGDMLWRLK